MFAMLVGLTLLPHADEKKTQPALPDRFIYASPLPALPPVIVDKLSTGVGIAQQTARSKGLQGRILWVDGTANLDRVNTVEKVQALVTNAKDLGFNTIVFDIKPIVGYTLYPSDLTGKLTRWRDAYLPLDFDPVPIMTRECHNHKLSIFVSLNAFSEGHRYAKDQENNPNSPFGDPGPGYRRPEEQTVQYVATPLLKLGQATAPMADSMNPKDLGTDGIGLYTTFPSVTGDVTVVVDSRGVVQYGIPNQLPSGGRYLIGKGLGAEFIRTFALPGRRMQIDTVHQFLRADQVQNQIPLMMNPTHPEVRQRVLAFAREVVTKYDIDGLLFDDRMRFGGVDADFSETTRKQFESYVKAKINWPDDVFKFTYNWNLERGSKPGPYWDRWWTWRARQLQLWVIAVKKMVKTLRPNLQFGIYAGSWYGEYNKWGANYARPGTRSGFSSVSGNYANTGFADQLDVFIAGCYYKTPTIQEAIAANSAEGRTVEAGAALANRVIHDQAWTYAGIMLQDYYDDPDLLGPALQAAAASSQGVMVFDYSHKIDSFASILKTAFKYPAKAPHQDLALLAKVREMQAKREKMGYKEPPIFLQPGSPGVGH